MCFSPILISGFFSVKFSICRAGMGFLAAAFLSFPAPSCHDMCSHHFLDELENPLVPGDSQQLRGMQLIYCLAQWHTFWILSLKNLVCLMRPPRPQLCLGLLMFLVTLRSFLWAAATGCAETWLDLDWSLGPDGSR